jgi:hypothetical protein
MYLGQIPVYLVVGNGCYTMLVYWLLSTVNPGSSNIDTKYTRLEHKREGPELDIGDENKALLSLGEGEQNFQSNNPSRLISASGQYNNTGQHIPDITQFNQPFMVQQSTRENVDSNLKLGPQFSTTTSNPQQHHIQNIPTFISNKNQPQSNPHDPITSKTTNSQNNSSIPAQYSSQSYPYQQSPFKPLPPPPILPHFVPPGPQEPDPFQTTQTTQTTQPTSFKPLFSTTSSTSSTFPAPIFVPPRPPQQFQQQRTDSRQQTQTNNNINPLPTPVPPVQSRTNPFITNLPLNTLPSTTQSPLNTNYSNLFSTANIKKTLNTTQTINSLYSSTICGLCMIDGQPPRTYHCTYCDKCYYLRHHHCFVLNTCITKKNISLYINLLFTILSQTVTLTALISYYFFLYTAPYNVPFPTFQDNFVIFGFYLILILSLFFIISSLLSQLMLSLSINITWAERQIIRRWATGDKNDNNTNPAPEIAIQSNNKNNNTPFHPHIYNISHNNLNSYEMSPNTLDLATLASPQPVFNVDMLIETGIGGNKQQNGMSPQPFPPPPPLPATSPLKSSPTALYLNVKHRLEYQRHWYGSLKAYFDIDIVQLEKMSVCAVLFSLILPAFPQNDHPNQNGPNSASLSGTNDENSQNTSLPPYRSGEIGYSNHRDILNKANNYNNNTYDKIDKKSNNFSCDQNFLQHNCDPHNGLFCSTNLPTISTNSNFWDGNDYQNCSVVPIGVFNRVFGVGLNLNWKNIFSPSRDNIFVQLISLLVFYYLGLFTFHFKWFLPFLFKIIFSPISILFYRVVVLTDDIMSLSDDFI